MRQSARRVTVAAMILVMSCFGSPAGSIEGSNSSTGEAVTDGDWASGRQWATEKEWIDFGQGLEERISYVTVIDSSVASLTLEVALPL